MTDDSRLARKSGRYGMVPDVLGITPFDDPFGFDPFGIDRMLSHVMAPIAGDMRELDAMGRARFSISDSNGANELDIELPGFAKDDIEVEVKNGYVTVSANRETKDGEKGPRTSSSINERFYVGDDIDAKTVHASLSDGVLHVSIPKAQLPEPGAKVEIGDGSGNDAKPCDNDNEPVTES